MKEFKSHELQSLINACYDAVDRSKVGPVFAIGKDGNREFDEQGNPKFGNLAYHTYIALINSLVPKNVSGDMIFKEGK